MVEIPSRRRHSRLHHPKHHVCHYGVRCAYVDYVIRVDFEVPLSMRS